MKKIFNDYQKNLLNGMDKRQAYDYFEIKYVQRENAILISIEQIIKKVLKIHAFIRTLIVKRDTINPNKYPLFIIRFKYLSKQIDKAYNHCSYLKRNIIKIKKTNTKYEKKYNAL